MTPDPISPSRDTPGQQTGRFVVLAYAITWSGVAVASLALPLASRFPALMAAMLAGPPLAALLVAGPRGLFPAPRLPLRWYILAPLVAPALILAVLLPMGMLVDDAFQPAFRPLLFAGGLVAGAAEEIGWTGLAAPRLLRLMPPLRAGLLLGLVWALWHAAADLSGNGAAMGAQWPLSFAVFWLACLIPFRLLMMRIYAATRSWPVAVLLHAGYTGGLLMLMPNLPPAQALAWQAPFAALLWLVALLAPGLPRR